MANKQIDFQTLQSNLFRIIRKDDMKFQDLEILLGPAPLMAGNDLFRTHVGEIIDLITKDRDGNGDFDIQDLVLFSKDLMAMTSFITILILIIQSLPNVKITYTQIETETLIFKLLVYVFLVIIPQKTSIDFSVEERENILNIALMLYGLWIQSETIQKIISQVAGWMKAECKMCISTGESTLERKYPKLKMAIQNAIGK